ncbi:Rho GAP domain-containing protein [Ordospora pajunii]|uniref:Rho GAP domain-containing protein n=1 Tax=Ordospora pajunii TaxID=3039483 RepID=UPI0029526F68|nr:Rho GAP domain-containing protein [Ordospora pajunii]KAH9412285.1 Rho GAP domain-containing protein [Ordospora pajunii]
MGGGANSRTASRDVRTVNGLGDEDFEVYRSIFFWHYDDLLKKYFGRFQRFRLRQSKLARMFFEYKAFRESTEWEGVSTSFRYGDDAELFVPRNFYILTETILSLDCKVDGIFRIGNSIEVINECVGIINECVDNNVSYEDAKQCLASRFSVIDMATAFKQVLREYPTTIVPEELMDTMLVISKVGNSEDQLVLCRMLFLAMPKPNRHVLEATINFLYTVHDISTNKGTDYEGKMNIEGISRIMMPNLVLKSHNQVDLDNIETLVNFMKMFFENFAQIVCLDENVAEL